MINARGLAYDSSGNLFVSQPSGQNAFWNNSILKITPDGTINTFISHTGGLNQPTSLAFNSAGNLFVLNDNHSISEITPSGSISTFASNNAIAGQSAGLAFDAIGNLYVPGGGVILKLSPSGEISSFAPDLNCQIGGIAFDSSSNLFACAQSGIIFKISTNGSVSTFASGGLIDQPTAIAIDPNNNLYVSVAVQGSYSQIVKIDQNGLVSPFISDSTNLLGTPSWGIAFNNVNLPIPEPSTYALFGIGAIGMLMVLRRKKTA